MRRRGVQRHRSLAFASILLACAPGLLAAAEFKEWRPITDLDWTAAPNEALGIQHAVILFDGNIIDDSDPDDPGTLISSYLRVRVFDEKGLEDLRAVELPFQSGSKVKRLKARTLKRDGTEIALQDNDVYEKTVVSYGRYRMKAKAFAFKGVEKGDILEYYYTLRTPMPIHPYFLLRKRYYTIESNVTWWFYLRPDLAGDLTREERDRYTFTPAWVLNNARQFTGTIKQLPDSLHPNRLSVVYQNLPALPDEPYMPAAEDVATYFAGYYHFPRLEARKPYWERVAEELGKETAAFIRRRDKLDGWMGPLLSGERDLEHDLSGCFDLIHRDIKNLDLLDEGEAPKDLPFCENVDDLLQGRYAPGYRINDLLVAMLRRLGHDATAFWVRDRSQGSFIREWRAAQQLTMSGVAIRTPSGLRFCFPSLPSAGTSSFPWEVCSCLALLEDLTDKRHDNPFPTFAETPVAQPDGNEARIVITLHADEPGKAAGRLEASWKLANDPFYLQTLANKARKGEKGVLELLRGRALRPGLVWSYQHEAYALKEDEASYSCSLRVEGLAEVAGSMQLWNLGSLRQDSYSLDGGTRECLIDFKYPARWSSEVRLAVPDGYAVHDLPGAPAIREQFGAFRSGYAEEDHAVVLRRELEIAHSLFRAEGAPKIGSFFEEVYKIHEQPVVLGPRASNE